MERVNLKEVNTQFYMFQLIYTFMAEHSVDLTLREKLVNRFHPYSNHLH